MSDLEGTLFAQMRLAGLKPEIQYRWCPGRRFQADFAFPEQKVLVEVQGAIWTRGRHTRGRGYHLDAQKLNLAQTQGWRVIYITPPMLKTTEAIDTIEAALKC